MHYSQKNKYGVSGKPEIQVFLKIGSFSHENKFAFASADY